MKKILIIEDDPIVGHIYKNRLEKEGYQVEVSADGQVGYYRIYDLKPDALLLDLMLPKMNGVDLLKKIRAVREFEKMPVVVFTNAYVAHMIHEAFIGGATAVYNKSSVTPRHIIDVLTSIFNGTFSKAESASKPQASAKAATPPAPAAASPAEPTETARTPAATAMSVEPDAPAHSDARPVAQPPPAASSSTVPVRLDGPDDPKEPITAPSPLPKPNFSSADDHAFETELLATFRAGNTASITEMRKLLQELSKITDEAQRVTSAEQLFRKVRTYAANSAMAGLPHVAKLAAATEALLKELLDKPKSISPSTLRTTACAIDCLGEITQTRARTDLLDEPPVRVLVVDDEILSRRAIVYALEKAYLKPVAVANPVEALENTARGKFDLIFLDIHLPGMDGFALCDKLRQNGPNKATPVVFVTGTADFQARAQSTLRGATDLIAKPFLFIELTVKALTFALKSRVEQPRRAPASAKFSRAADPSDQAVPVIL